MSWRVVSVSVVMALALLGDSLLYVVLPLHAAALGLSGLQVGILLSANRFVRMATNTATSRLLRRMAPGPLFSAATAAAAITTATYAMTPAFALLLLARLLWGLCYSALRLGCFLTVLAATDARGRGRLMGVYQSVSRAGSFVAVVAGGALFDAFGFRAALLTMAAGTALALPLALRWGPDRRSLPTAAPSAADARARPRRRWSLPDPRSPLLAVKWSGFTLAFAARGVVTATLAVYLQRAFGDQLGRDGAVGVATLASWLIGVRWASEICLATPLGALSDRTGRAPAALGWLLAAAAAMALLGVAPSAAIAAAAAVALFVAATGVSATLDAAAGDLAPAERRAQVMSSYADWTDLGAALGPLLALAFIEQIGLRPVYTLGALLLVSAAVGVPLSARGGGWERERRRAGTLPA